jgi:WD repeat-containing protein mio
MRSRVNTCWLISGLGYPVCTTFTLFVSDFPVSKLISQPDLHDFLTIPTPIVHGYDFGYQGLLGVWEGSIPNLPMSHQSLSDPSPNTTNSPYHDRRSSRHADDHSGGSGNFHAALSALLARRVGTGDMRSWKPGVATVKGVQRQVALLMCGWCLREEEMMVTIRKWVFSSATWQF